MTTPRHTVTFVPSQTSRSIRTRDLAMPWSLIGMVEVVEAVVEVGDVDVVGDQRAVADLDVEVAVDRDVAREVALVAERQRALVAAQRGVDAEVHPLAEDQPAVAAAGVDLRAAVEEDEAAGDHVRVAHLEQEEAPVPHEVPRRVRAVAQHPAQRAPGEEARAAQPAQRCASTVTPSTAARSMRRRRQIARADGRPRARRAARSPSRTRDAVDAVRARAEHVVRRGRRPSPRRPGRAGRAGSSTLSMTSAFVGSEPSSSSPPIVSKYAVEAEVFDDRHARSARACSSRRRAGVRRACSACEQRRRRRGRPSCRTSPLRVVLAVRRRSPASSVVLADQRRQRLVERRPEQRALGRRRRAGHAVHGEARAAASRGCPAPSRTPCRRGRTARPRHRVGLMTPASAR